MTLEDTKKSCSRSSPPAKGAAADAGAPKAATAKRRIDCQHKFSKKVHRDPRVTRQENESLPEKADGCMIKPRKPKTKWHSPRALADQANDGFLFVVRSTGRIVRSVPSDIVNGVSRVGQVLIRRKKKMIKPPTEPLEAAPPEQDASPKAAARARETEASSRGVPEAAEAAQSARSRVAIEEPALDGKTGPEGPQYLSPDMERLLKQHAPEDTVQAAMLREALDDLLPGSEGAGRGGLETLVALGQVAEPLLVACLQTDFPRVVEIALEGLRQIGSQRLVDSISDVFGSSDTELRIIALRAAVRLPDDQQQPLLERGLRDPSARVRRRALSYLSWHDSSWAIAEIMRLCDDQEPDVRWAAVEALMVLRPSEAYDHLELMMPSLDSIHQRRAASLLQQRNGLPAKNRQKSADAQSSQGRKPKRRESKQTKKSSSRPSAKKSSARSKPRSTGSRKTKR